MRVHLDNVNPRSMSGPNTFATRLSKELFARGHEVAFESKGCDVSLVFIERSGAPLAPKVVQRLDGIWFKPHEFETKNVGIKGLYGETDAVVWQSRFDREMTIRHFGLRIRDVARRRFTSKGHVTDVDVVIHNGIDMTPVKQLTIPKLIEMRAAYDQIYVCSSNWHPQKRLDANVALFERLRTRHPNSCLIIMGANPDVRVSGTHVFYTGSVEPDVYNQIYSAADWMLHLAWADHCPNVVVEALAQGTPVVCSDVGGTKELVGSYGLVLKDDPYDYELADYDNPPSIDVNQVDLDAFPTRTQLDYGSIADIDVKSVADRYLRLFESLIV